MGNALTFLFVGPKCVCFSQQNFERSVAPRGQVSMQKLYAAEFFGSALFSDVLVLTRSPFLGCGDMGPVLCADQGICGFDAQLLGRQANDRKKPSFRLVAAIRAIGSK